MKGLLKTIMLCGSGSSYSQIFWGKSVFFVWHCLHECRTVFIKYTGWEGGTTRPQNNISMLVWSIETDTKVWFRQKYIMSHSNHEEHFSTGFRHLVEHFNQVGKQITKQTKPVGLISYSKKEFWWRMLTENVILRLGGVCVWKVVPIMNSTHAPRSPFFGVQKVIFLVCKNHIPLLEGSTTA